MEKFIITVWKRVLGVEEHVGEAWVLRSLDGIRILWEWELQPTDNLAGYRSSLNLAQSKERKGTFCSFIPLGLPMWHEW